jgi:hypothetical protein
MTWKDILKFNKKSLADIAGEMDNIMGGRTKFREAYEGGRYGNESESKDKLIMLLDELKYKDNSKATELINHIKAMPSF